MNNEIIEKIIEKYNLDLGDDYFFVGATIIKKSDFPNSTEILYCEDGFNDEEGIPYIMQSVVPKGVLNRDRIIVLYTAAHGTEMVKQNRLLPETRIYCI